MTEYELVKKEGKEETKTESSKPDDTNKNDNNEVKTPKHVLVNKEGIRERKRQPIQNNPEPVNQPLPSLTDFAIGKFIETCNKIVKEPVNQPLPSLTDFAIGKFTETCNTIIKYCNEYPLRTIAIGLIVIIFAFIYGGPLSSGTTKIVFEEINSVELPAVSAITQHTVAYRSAASMIRHSPAFGNYSSIISYDLLKFAYKITDAGRHLQTMYIKGSSAYRSFDTEIEAMMERLNSDRSNGDAEFFKDRISRLITNIREFRKAVYKAQRSIIDAETIRQDTEGFIIDGLREAEEFISNDERHTVDLANAKKGIESANNVLEHLQNTAGHLDTMNEILMNYEDRLLDVESALENAGDVGDDIFEVTNEDLSYLKKFKSMLL